MVNVVVLALLLVALLTQALPWFKVRWVTVDTLEGWLDGPEPPTVVDIRTREEYDSGHLPDAVLLPLTRLRQAPHLVPVDARVVLVGRSSYRELQGFQALQRRGFQELYCLRGGILAFVRHRWAVGVGDKP